MSGAIETGSSEFRPTEPGLPPAPQTAGPVAVPRLTGLPGHPNLVADTPAPAAIPADAASPAPVTQAKGVRRVLLVAAGLACVGMGYLGAILPGLPTTPWVLLAGECFRRSSPRLQRWLRRSPVFGRLVRDWEDHRGIRRPVKVFAVCLILTVVTLSILSGRLPVWARWVVGGCAACGVCTIVFVVPTVRDGRRGS